jgi:hypothetical protein
MHEPVEDAIQRSGGLYVMEIPWKPEDRDSKRNSSKRRIV